MMHQIFHLTKDSPEWDPIDLEADKAQPNQKPIK